MFRWFARNMATAFPRDRISIAPMLDVTNECLLTSFVYCYSYQRYIIRMMSRHVTLYSEMFVDEMLIRAPQPQSLIEYWFT